MSFKFMLQISLVFTYKWNVFMFTVLLNQVIYSIYDPEHQASESIIAHHEKEMAFMGDYYNKTGIHWRHYYGPNGPRPPPILYMWPADIIGQTHKVESPEGYW